MVQAGLAFSRDDSDEQARPIQAGLLAHAPMRSGSRIVALAATTSSRNRAARVSICTSFASTIPKRSVAGSNTRKRNRGFGKLIRATFPLEALADWAVTAQVAALASA